MSDLIERQAAIDIELSATVDTNPTHFEAHQKFTQFMDDAEISSFGRWQWSNGFNTALTAVGIDLKKLPSAQPEPQWIPIFKAKDEDSDHWVTGFYFAYPETTYCFTEDYKSHPVKIIHCITFHRMTDWCLPNRPAVCNIDIDTLELVGWVDSKRKTFGNEPWILPEPWRGGQE